MDIGIIGKGIAGLTTAIAILEKKPEHTCWIFAPQSLEDSASYGALGVMSSKGLILANNSIFYEKIAGGCKLLQSLDPSIPQIKGIWEPYADKDEFQLRKDRSYHRYSTGAFLYKKETSFLESFIKKSSIEWFQGAFFYPQDGWFDPRCYLNFLVKKAEDLGVRFIDGSITQFSSTEDKKLQIHIPEVFPKKFDELIICSGFGTDEIFKASQFYFEKTIFLSKGSTWFFSNPHPDSFVLKFGKHSLISYNNLFLTGGFEKWEDMDKGLARILEPLISGKSYQEISRERAFVQGKEPVIGSFPFGGHRIICNFGYYKNGFALASYGAQRVLDALRG
jgi:hypothetical protein